MKAIFPGSFDPITNGHLEIISRASKLFDKLVVVVSNNTSKNGMFSPQQRYQFVKDAVSVYPNVSVSLVQSDLTVNLVHELNADVIVRDVRNNEDFVYEQQIALMTKKMDPNIETLILFSNPECSYISSSIVREIMLFGGDISDAVPACVNRALIRMKNQHMARSVSL